MDNNSAGGEGAEEEEEEEEEEEAWRRQQRQQQQQQQKTVWDGAQDDDPGWAHEGSFVWRGVEYRVGDCVLVNGDVAYTAEINGKTHDVQDKTDIWVTKILAFQHAVSSFLLSTHWLFAVLTVGLLWGKNQRKCRGTL